MFSQSIANICNYLVLCEFYNLAKSFYDLFMDLWNSECYSAFDWSAIDRSYLWTELMVARSGGKSKSYWISTLLCLSLLFLQFFFLLIHFFIFFGRKLFNITVIEFMFVLINQRYFMNALDLTGFSWVGGQVRGRGHWNERKLDGGSATSY